MGYGKAAVQVDVVGDCGRGGAWVCRGWVGVGAGGAR